MTTRAKKVDGGYRLTRSKMWISADVARTPIVLVTSASNSIQTFQDLLQAIRWGKQSFASSSNGTPGHLVGELFKQLANLDSTHIPYKGAAPALTDVIGDQVLYMFDSMPSSISLMKGGTLRPLGVSSQKRVNVLPDVPTFNELNFNSLNLTTWYGMWGPTKMPATLADQLQREVSAVRASADVRKAFLTPCWNRSATRQPSSRCFRRRSLSVTRPLSKLPVSSSSKAK